MHRPGKNTRGRRKYADLKKDSEQDGDLQE